MSSQSCREVEVLISLRAARALDPAQSARLEAHLATCHACRDEARATEELLAMVKLPPPSEAERRAMAELPARTLSALRGRERRGSLMKKMALGGALAAAAALAVVTPALLLHSPTVSPDEVAAAERAAWQEPDLDTIWEDTQVLQWDTAAVSGGASATSTDAVLAVYDAGLGN